MKFKYLTLTSLSLLTLSACTASPVQQATPLPQLTYEHLTKIPVNVKRIEFSSKTQRGAQAWDIASTLPTPPDVAMRRYLEQRFKPAAADGLLDVVLTKAQITKADAPNENKLLSYIPLANNEDYTIEIIVDIESLYLSGMPDRQTTTRFVRKIRMPLNVTMAYREARLQRTLEEMVRDIDESMILTLSDQMNLISKRNIPVHTIDVKTFVPKTQTKMGDFAEGVGDGVREMRTSVQETFENIDTNEPYQAEPTEKAKSVQPVQITPLKN